MGMRLGPPEYIHARGDVNLEDGLRLKRTATGQSMEYRRDTDTVTILGYLPGLPRTHATMNYKDLDANKLLGSWSSPSIVWNRATDTVKTEEGTGTGTR
jgi:hypothetical protein